MSDISSIVAVTTTLSGRVATSAGFGTPLVVGYHTKYADRVREYTTLAGLVADGFATTDAIYRAVAAILAQDPTVESVKVGRLASTPVAQVWTLTPAVEDQGLYVVTINDVEVSARPAITITPTAANTTAYTVTIDGTDYTVTSDADATATEIVTLFKTAINADTATHGFTATGTATLILTSAGSGKTPVASVADSVGGLSIAANTSTEVCTAIIAAIQASTVATVFVETGSTTVVLTTSAAGTVPKLAYSSNLTAQVTGAATSAIATDLAAISAQDDDWYGLVHTSYNKAEIIATAAAVESLKKVAFLVTCDDDVLSTAYAAGDDSSDDVATRLFNLGYTRTYLFFSRGAGAYPNAAIAGAMLQFQPGEATFAFKALAGIAADVFTTTAESRLRSKHCNAYVTVGGLSMTLSNGINASGLYTDARIFADYVDARIAEQLLSALANAKKVPYTDEGIASLAGVVESFLRKEEKRGTLVRDSTVVTFPTRAEQETADIAARIVDGITYECTYSGAVHKVVITGNIAG